MAFWKNDDSFAPFNVPQVGPTIPAMPMPDAKDSELAKLRADLDQSRRDRNSAVECAEVLRGYVAAHKAALAAARAALDGEREECAEICDRVAMMTDLAAMGTATRCADAIRASRSRRAAEAIAVPPNRTGTTEESQAIADWHHDEINRRAAEAKASRGGEGKP